jgi:hypothetical protein
LSNAPDEALRELTVFLVGYGSAAGLDVAALLLAALCYLAGAEAHLELDTSQGAAAVPEHYYPH